jgi:hypothetical protein
MKKMIPAREVLTCDVCDLECSPSMRKHECVMTFKANALDHLGYAVAGGVREYDLCDDCYSTIWNFVASSMKP